MTFQLFGLGGKPKFGVRVDAPNLYVELYVHIFLRARPKGKFGWFYWY